MVSDPPGWRSPYHHAARRGAPPGSERAWALSKIKVVLGERPIWVLYPNGATCYKRFHPRWKVGAAGPAGLTGLRATPHGPDGGVNTQTPGSASTAARRAMRGGDPLD